MHKPYTYAYYFILDNNNKSHSHYNSENCKIIIMYEERRCNNFKSAAASIM